MVNLLTTPRWSQNFTYFFMVQSFGENVCSLLFSRPILQFDRTIFYKLSNEVSMDLNMFGTLVEDWIFDKFYHPLVVIE